MVTGAPVCLAPADLAQARQAMVEAAQVESAVVIRGGGTKGDWGGTGPPADVVVATGRLDGLIAHNSGDLTAVVEAGMGLGRLQEELARFGQWLAIDPGSARRGATVGGVMAAGDAGPRRHRYGTMADLAIGATVVLSDGAVARSGGQVIKNVAGYDLAKLLCGSLGTLGLVARVAVRLHPLAPASRTVRVPSSPGQATSFVLDVLAAPAVPSAVDWAEGATWVRIEGTKAGVMAQVDTVAALAAGAGLCPDVLSGAEEGLAWERLGDLPYGLMGPVVGARGAVGAGPAVGAPGSAVGGPDGVGLAETVARAGTRPGRLGQVAEGLARAAGEAGVGSALASHAGVGLHTALLWGGDDDAHARTVVAWREAVTAMGGTVVVHRRRPGVEEGAGVWGPAPSAVAVMARVKERLDPGGRLGIGRFAPWW